MGGEAPQQSAVHIHTQTHMALLGCDSGDPYRSLPASRDGVRVGHIPSLNASPLVSGGGRSFIFHRASASPMNGSSLSAAARFTNRGFCPPSAPLTADFGAVMDDEYATRQPMIGGAGRGDNTSLSMRVQAHAHKRVHTLPLSPLAHHSLLDGFFAFALGLSATFLRSPQWQSQLTEPNSCPGSAFALSRSICIAKPISSQKL